MAENGKPMRFRDDETACRAAQRLADQQRKPFVVEGADDGWEVRLAKDSDSKGLLVRPSKKRPVAAVPTSFLIPSSGVAGQ